MKHIHFLLFLLIISAMASCSSGSAEVNETKNDPSEVNNGTPDDGRGAEYEAYIASIDNSDSLVVANTLYYTKSNGESYQVYVLLDDSSNIVRSEERYTTSNSGSVLTNYFYYRDGEKYASRELFIDNSGEKEAFVERVSYYEDGKPKISKMRRAPYEEYLENETFEIIEPHNCSDARADRALHRTGEFQTNFVSVVREDPATYLIVGEGSEDGFVSSLVVQSITPLVGELLSNPDAHVGEPMQVMFEEVHDGSGFTYQSLLGIQRVQ